MPKGLNFLVARLRHSSIRELFHRCKELFFFRFVARFDPIFDSSCECSSADLEFIRRRRLPRYDGRVDISLINEIIGGKNFCLHASAAMVEAFEKQSCETFFSKVHLSPSAPDIRAIWEKGRLQNLSLLLQAIEKKRLLGPEATAAFARTSLLAWLDRHRFGYGVHYMSAMECALRVPLFLKALQVADGWSPEEMRQIAWAIYRHGWLSRKRLSLFSSLGNHTVAESVGLVFAGAVYCDTKAGAEWLATGIALLEQECLHQILPDGGPIEQSFAYHRFVLDLYWLAIDFLERNGLHNCLAMKERVVSGEKFLDAMQQAQEPHLRVGDSDDGHAIAPGLYPAIREEYRGRITPEPVMTFPDAGYTILRTKAGGRLLMDHGPLGMAPLYNHGHADALSVWLAVGSVDFLTDSGTYQYNGDQRLRRYFKSTRAHNTVTIDGCDQADQLTSFIWGKPFFVEWSRGQTLHRQEFMVGKHNGYHRLPRPVTHVRKLTRLEDELFMVEDSFEGEGQHGFELNFHLHPEVKVDIVPGGVLLQNGGQEVGLCCVGEQFAVIQGAEEPLCGWYSPSYGVLETTKTLQIRKDGLASRVRFLSFIRIGGVVTEMDIHNAKPGHPPLPA